MINEDDNHLNTLVGSLSFKDWFHRVALQDLFSTSEHSRDFNGMRAEYICIRIRLLSLLFALMSTFWIFIDYFTLEGEKFTGISILRLIFTGFFIFLTIWTPSNPTLKIAYLKLFVLFLIPGLFYLGSQLVLGVVTENQGIVHGYMFFPFLMVSLMALFPLALNEGLSFAVLTGIPLILINVINGTLLSLESMGKIWSGTVGWNRYLDSVIPAPYIIKALP